MKRLFAMLLALAMVFALIGCTQEGTAPETTIEALRELLHMDGGVA